MADLIIASLSDFREFWLDGLRVSSLAEQGVQPEPGPEVWWCYASEYSPDRRVDLLIEPGELGQLAKRQLTRRLNDIGSESSSTNLAQGFGYVTAELTFSEFVQALVPLTDFKDLLEWFRGSEREVVMRAMMSYRRRTRRPDDQLRGWFAFLLLAVSRRLTKAGRPTKLRATRQALDAVMRIVEQAEAPSQTTVRRVAINRKVRPAVARSGRTIKADAATRLFGVSCAKIRWAVVDSGVDARHSEFLDTNAAGDLFDDPFEYVSSDGVSQSDNCTRVDETLDFTRFREGRRLLDRDADRAAKQKRSIGEQRFVADADSVLPPDVPIPMTSGHEAYTPPPHGHGTHVAGIIGGRGGLCADIRLVDLRVLGEGGVGDEFAVLTALRYIRDRNQRFREQARSGRTRDLYIHGVNLSLALDPDVSSDACGWSLVCRACDELVRSGVVVVVAAGNAGHEVAWGQSRELYSHTTRTVSIADPGNTERVITVGSTNPDRPLEYGVSYFSARGPTADGRLKPDLVAPGEDISSAHGYVNGDDQVSGAMLSRNGTSQAAAHVSAAAAMLLARNSELIGKPDEVKKILCDTATDLGRDRNFQGHGLVDTLRALQEI